MSGQEWDIKPCGENCSGCGKPFADRQNYVSSLVHGEGGYERRDYCADCSSGERQAELKSLSSWKGVYRMPPPPVEVLKKETAETMLRKLMETSDRSMKNAIYVLAAMLERKRILVEREIRKEADGSSTIVYEHRKTDEMFLIPDPGLRLDQLEDVQREVSELLGAPAPGQGQAPASGGQPADAPADASAEPAE